jgi:hypothetical protein
MLFNIIIFFIILIILTLILRHSKQYKEGFFDFPDVNHNLYVQDSETKFNQLTNTINLINPSIPVSPDSASAFNIALGGLDAQPTASSYNLKPKTDFVIPQQSPGTFQQAKSCESAAASCDAFDDPDFAANCGMSFDKKGMGVDGKPHIGGMFISSADRQKQTDAANVVLSTGGAPYDPYKVYQPTLGKAKPGTFALTKDQCIVVKEKVDCAAKQTFSSPNCTQCYTSQRFARVGPETGRIPSTLYLFGSGNTYVASTNNTITLSTTKLDPTNATTVEIPADAEGTLFSVIAQQPNNNPLPYIAGYIQGQTPRGTFKLDLFNLVESDQVSKTKPKLNGTVTVNGFRCLTMIPGTGQTYLNLMCIMPFSFLSMYDGDALTCDNGPIITQAASATFLESDPCFGKANKPGNYKLECLQTRWIELGGTPQGTGYPSNQKAADALQKDANGNPLDIDTIINNLAPKMTTAQTGQDPSGKDLSIPDWNTVSMWATGTPINTPCDGPNSQSGPLTQECLTYLYTNQGVNSHIGPTYTLAASAMASMKGQKTANTYCQPGTSIDPATPAGLKFAQSIGGINAVKQTYDQINRLANDNSQTNNARSQAVQQCYGVSIDAMSAPKGTGPIQVFAVGPGYNYTNAQAPQVCAKYGAQVATKEQVQEAQTYGANWCFGAMVADDTNNGYYPMNVALPGCGNSVGLQQYGLQWAPNTDGTDAHLSGKGNIPTGMLGVNCYGPKPTIDSYPVNTIMPFSQTQWDSPSSPPAPSNPQGVFTCLGELWPNSAGQQWANHRMYYADTNVGQSNMNWINMPGGSIAITLAPNGVVFCLGPAPNYYVYYMSSYKNNSWNQTNGELVQIHTDGNFVCGANINNSPWYASVSQVESNPSNVQWMRLPDTAKKVITYNGGFLIIGLTGMLYYLSSPAASGWYQCQSQWQYKDIAIDEDGVLIVIGMDNNLYYATDNNFTQVITYVPVTPPSNSKGWQSISISKGSIYAIDTTGNPWYLSNYKQTNWVQLPGSNELSPSHRMTQT